MRIFKHVKISSQIKFSGSLAFVANAIIGLVAMPMQQDSDHDVELTFKNQHLCHHRSRALATDRRDNVLSLLIQYIQFIMQF